MALMGSVAALGETRSTYKLWLKSEGNETYGSYRHGSENNISIWL
jgi:hypothetical protein